MTRAADHCRDKWDAIYRCSPEGPGAAPAEVLWRNAHLLPATGTALDLAAGLGGNALFLAARGLATSAWDISSAALDRLAAAAATQGRALTTEVRDVVAHPPDRESFDVMVVSCFLDRSLAGPLVAALRPGGLLFYETFTREKARPGGPSNPDYLLAPNELLALFRGLRVVVYREEGLIGDPARGWRNRARFVGYKCPSSI